MNGYCENCFRFFEVEELRLLEVKNRTYFVCVFCEFLYTTRMKEEKMFVEARKNFDSFVKNNQLDKEFILFSEGEKRQGKLKSFFKNIFSKQKAMRAGKNFSNEFKKAQKLIKTYEKNFN